MAETVSNEIEKVFRICVVGKNLKNDEKLVECVKSLNNNEMEFCDAVERFVGAENGESDTAFVLEEFEGSNYDLLKKHNMKRVWGSTLVKDCVAKQQPLPINPRPLYCNAMHNLVICFTGFQNRDDIFNMVSLVHHMGGSIRKDFSSRVTHLVANSTAHEKYKYAVTFGTAIMSSEWIFKTWERRHDVDCVATDAELMKWKLQPFFNCRIVFVGFSEDEQKHVEQLTIENGGSVTTLRDDAATHVVIDEQNTDIEINEEIPSRAHVIRAEWFWATIQMDACADESMYVYKQLVESPPAKSTPIASSSLTPVSKQRKRKRLRETLGQLAQLPETTCSSGFDRRLSTDTLGASFSSSILDSTTSPDKICNEVSQLNEQPNNATVSPPGIKSPVELKRMSARQQVCSELLQTENNYVGILNMIITRFKEPLEVVDHVRGALLGPTEVKIIFGNVPPIYEVHKKIRDDLSSLMANWNEECGIGSVFLKHSGELLKAYPPFVNFFENTKEMLLQCDRTRPRFHAFLKICQSKPECGRQTLSELLIRPVQRLPSIILLLNDILKHTKIANLDYPRLEESMSSLKEILKSINENKRKTEGQVAMFDVVNDIENCPPNLLSSHRTFVTRVDVIELSNSACTKGDNVSLFVFSDMLEICKRRTKLLSAMKSPSTTSMMGARNQTKVYKHVELMPLSHVKRVVNIMETEECKNVFALVCRSNHELKEKLYSFAIVGNEVDKMEFLKTLCRNVANTICRADVENFLTSLEPHQLDIETSEVSTNSLSKAMSRLASKTSRKVGRAFSFNRTPRTLKRAMSSMISPFQTPVQLNERHLGQIQSSPSVADLQEMDFPSGSRSAKISKKVKSSSFGASSTKLL